MNILIVDDEKLARKRIRKLLEHQKQNYNIVEVSTGKDSVEQLKKNKFDIVFLDIQLTDMTGFDILAKLNIKKIPIIIFVTAFDNFAVKAFEVQAIDFLLKPYKTERFYESLQRAELKIKSDNIENFRYKINDFMEFINNTPNDDYLDKIVFKSGKKFLLIDVNNIKYFKSSAYYAEIFTNDNVKHLYRISMSSLIEKLNPKDFIRISRSAIININQIKEIYCEGYGDYSIKMKDNKSFSLTNSYKKNFLRAINIKNND